MSDNRFESLKSPLFLISIVIQAVTIVVTVTYDICGGRDVSVGITTRYALDGPRFESRLERVFLHPYRANPDSYTTGSRSFQEVK